jgi:nondiscriminating glutamyl-tRNA synthetase
MTDLSSAVRVRIAPSPTGNLHIGTARTTLFNYLFARHCGGTLLLRIEDTDQLRSQAAYTDNILAGLKGLGLSWDEGPGVGGAYGPYYQSERMPIYHEALAKLEATEKVYPCFCTEVELQAERQEAEQTGATYVYSGRCRGLAPERAQARMAAGEHPVWRLKVPLKTVAFEDLIRGPIEIQSALIGDIIIAKSDRTPVYNFAVVVDDVQMRITHVLRGEDHISNTPKQILIYEALAVDKPVFGHFPMILAPDRSKLSKRHGATSVSEYLERGFLPEALLNYLALLGWSAPENREVLALEELAELFALEKVNRSGAIFDIEKLTWLNAHWLRRLPVAVLRERLQPVWQSAHVDLPHDSREWLEAVITLVQEKCRLLSDFLPQADFLLQADFQLDLTQVEQAGPAALDVIQAFMAALMELATWDTPSLQAVFATLKAQLPYKMKEVMWPLRAALTGRTAGPDLHESIRLLGRERTLARLKRAAEHLSQ